MSSPTKIEEILNLPLSKLESLSNKELHDLLSPLFPAVRNAEAVQPKKQAAVNDMLAQLQRMLAEQNSKKK